MMTLAIGFLSSAGYGQQPVSNFSLADVTGKTVSLDSYPTVSGITIIFTSNDCAFDNYYTSRIRSLIEMYSGKIQFILINASVEPAETAEKMAIQYQSWGFDIPYLIDKSQTAMDIFGARKSPETFLLRNSGGKYFVVYQCALADNPHSASEVKQNYLKENIDKLLAHQRIEVSAVRATGCSIRRR